MQKVSTNIVFIYSLLIVDLLVNITDNLLSPAIASQDTGKHGSISILSFAIVIIQVVAIICVIINLVLHFFEASDQVRHLSWSQKCCNSHRSSASCEPMPQRVALKLVLDRYWWSLVVGLLYLVLTIILQIVRIDSSILKPDIVTGTTEKSLYEEELNTDKSSYQNLRSLHDEIALAGSEKPPGSAEIYHSSFALGSYSFRNLLPTLVLLIHKLISTCYYVSFVVVYRTSPSNMGSRVLSNKTT